MISLCMYLVCCHPSADSSLQVLLFLSLKETNTAELKSCHSFIMWSEKSICSKQEYKFHCMTHLGTVTLKKKILKTTFLSWCLHFPSYKIYRKLSILFMLLLLWGSSSFSLMLRELGKYRSKICWQVQY